MMFQKLIQKSTGCLRPLFNFGVVISPLGLEQASENTGGVMKKQIQQIHFIFCQPGP